MKKLVLSLIAVSIILIACSKKQESNEVTTKKVYGAWKSLSKEDAQKKIESFKANRLSKDIDTNYAYDDDGHFIYYYILPAGVDCDSLIDKELADAWFFYPLVDCRGNCAISLAEIQGITNPDYLYLQDLLTYNDSLPYCFPTE